MVSPDRLIAKIYVSHEGSGAESRSVQELTLAQAAYIAGIIDGEGPERQLEIVRLIKDAKKQDLDAVV
jgi:hypothetical protein